MCDLTIEQPLNAITASQINEMTISEIKQTIQHGAPNYLTLQTMAVELAARCTALEQSQAA